MTDNARMTAMPPRFFFVDARAALFIPPILFHPSTVTLMAFMVVMVILTLLERRGYTVPVALRMLRLFFTSFGEMPIRIYRKPEMSRWRDRTHL